MPLEHSAGAVIFRREGKKIYYLLLHYTNQPGKKRKDYWDFSKGHIEAGENAKMACVREVKEETGIEDLHFVGGFKRNIKYFFIVEGKKIFKIVTLFLARTRTQNIVISDEHEGYMWLEFQPALKAMKFKNAKNTLIAAHTYLNAKRNTAPRQ